ncbi:glycosyltransferase family 2 protein [Desulfosudis oleivorans]|uniref:Glycosyl transferase family 2 n=1 Tax=Desulfosudis oleivorans (strain DSM 6200 / JCM 39069 / Hxd3) TaxID=96561 RepID=A8ZWI7_DESOH|nr:glycosyl transferase family 2 [Desulfosudis oleivorans Hxd3]
MNRTSLPLVSVVIPTYNRGPMVTEAVASVLAQDYPAIEIIIVDDGSSDDTPGRLSPLKNRVTIITQENRGVSAARNAGVAHAGGEYIAFLDSDDRWLPEKISTQTAFFASRPDALICQTEETWIKNGKPLFPRARHKKRSGMIFEPSLELCLVSPSAVMMRKDFFLDVGGFDESLPACEDYDLWLRISMVHPVYLIETPLVIKQGGHDGQLSAMPGLDRYRIYAICKAIDTGRLSEDQHRAALAMLKEKCRIYAAGCEKRGRREEAARYRTMATAYGNSDTPPAPLHSA